VIDIKNGDCLELMKNIPDNSIDMILTDPPYKITARGNGGNSGGMFQKKEVNNGKVFKPFHLNPPCHYIESTIFSIGSNQ
jgi:DNA modification methylase